MFKEKMRNFDKDKEKRVNNKGRKKNQEHEKNSQVLCSFVGKKKDWSLLGHQKIRK